MLLSQARGMLSVPTVTSHSPVGTHLVKLHTPCTNDVAQPSSLKSVAPRAEAAVCGLDP